MSDLIKRIRTIDGDKQIDYNALANTPSFKTINNESIIGSGDIKIKVDPVDLSDYAKKSEVALKQDKLISGSNIKTINGNSVLGSGDIILTADGYKTEDVITRYEPVYKKVFEGKKLWVFGDSITAGVGTTAPYYFAELLKTELGCTSVTRKGNSGFAFSHGIGDYGSCILNKMTDLDNAPGNCDILIVCFGVNDWTWGRAIEGDRAIGSLFDTTKYTICGAVNLFCQELQERFKDYPETKIYFSTPTPTKNAPISGGNTGKTWDQSKQNYNGNTLRDICRAIIKTAALYGYQSLDLNLYFDGDITDHAAMDAAFPDGLHPNEDGNQKMATTLKNLLIANPITTFTFNPLTFDLSPLAKRLIYRTKSVEAVETPNITSQPQSATYNIGQEATPLSVSASVSDGGTLSYNWYKDNLIMEEQVNTTYTPDISTVGSHSYFCKVTNTKDGKEKTIASSIATITVLENPAPSGGLDLDTLELSHIVSSGGSGENMSYDTSTHDFSVKSTGWYKSSYINTPIHIGDEVELTTYFDLETTTSGNAVLIYAESEVNSPAAIAGSFWPGTRVFGMYVPGTSGVEKSFQWDSSKNAIPGYDDAALRGEHNIVLKLKAEGVELYIDNSKVTLHHSNALTEGTNYYFGIRGSTNKTNVVAASLKYIGSQR